MSLHPQPFTAVPLETARVARAAFPQSNLCMYMRDELQPILQYHPYGTFSGRFEPACKIPETDAMLDFPPRDLHQNTSGAAAQVLVAPLMLAEGVQGLSDGFVKGLRGDLNGMLDAEGIEAGDLTSS